MTRDAARRRRVATPLRAAPDVWIGALLIVATVAIYAPVRHHAFLNYDDDEYVTDNAAVRAGLTSASVVWAFTSTHSATWHPLTGLSHMLDVKLFGLRAGAHLLVNVLLHAIATVLLFHVLRITTGARWPSAWVAALFALHPLHVESVAWVSERKDVLSAVFWMLTLWCYARYVRVPDRARYCLLVAVFALGLMAKPMLVTLPFVLLLLDVWPLRRGPRLGEKLPLVALAAAVSVVTFVVQSRAGAVVPLAAAPLGLRVANALVAYVSYLRKTIWPADLAVFYPMAPVSVWRAGVAAAVLLAVSALILRERRRRPYLLVGWLWYLGTLVPVIGLVRQGEQAMADRFTYLPHVGLFIMIAWGAAELRGDRRRRMVALAGGATIAACALVTARQLTYWQDSEALFGHALAVTAGNYVAHTNLGVVCAARGARDEAMRHYEEALRIEPAYAKAHLNLGALLADRGDADGAVARYAAALRLDPTLAPAEYDWGLVLDERGEHDAAIPHFERAVAYAPAYAKAHAGLAAALAAAGRRDEAIEHYRAALRLAPDLVAAHNNLALALEDAGRPDEALVQYTAVVRLAPDDPRGRYNLGALLAGHGRLADAAAQYREALRLRPDAPEPAVALAWILATAPDAALRDGPEAVTLAERARAGSSGDDPRVLDTLAAAYAAVGRNRDAVTAAERALAGAHAAGDAALAADIESRLRRYRAS